VKAPVNFVMSARPPVLSLHVSVRLPLDRLLWNLMLETLLKSVPKMGHRCQAFYMKTDAKLGTSHEDINTF